jgi:hypothetical protein
LTQYTTCGEGLRAIESSDIIETQESPLEYVVTARIFPIDPPGEIQEELLENSFQELQVLATIHLPLDLEHTESCPEKALRETNMVADTKAYQA